MYLFTSGELSLILRCKVAFLRAVFPDTPLMSSAVWLVISRMLPWRFRFSGDALEPLFLTGLWPTSPDQPCLHTASGSPAALQHCPTIFSLLPSPVSSPARGLPVSWVSIIQELETGTPEGTPLCLFTQSTGSMELHVIHKQRGHSLTSPCHWINSCTEFR